MLGLHEELVDELMEACSVQELELGVEGDWEAHLVAMAYQLEVVVEKLQSFPSHAVEVEHVDLVAEHYEGQLEVVDLLVEAL